MVTTRIEDLMRTMITTALVSEGSPAVNDEDWEVGAASLCYTHLLVGFRAALEDLRDNPGIAVRRATTFEFVERDWKSALNAILAEDSQ